MRFRAVLAISLLAVFMLGLPAPLPAQEIPASQALEVGESESQSIRGLTFEQEVPVRYFNRDELKQHLIDFYATHYPTEQQEQDEAVLKLLGLVGGDVDYPRLMLDLYTEQIAAFYENEDDYIAFLAGQENAGPYQLNNLIHEYVHALQDQNFDIHRPPFYDDRDGVNDLTLAGISLVEGDASICNQVWYGMIPEQEYQAIFDEAESIPTPVYDAAPDYVKSRLYFPYEEGLDFARYLYDAQGFEAINLAYADPPASTEQVIHPEKYTAGEKPADVETVNVVASLGKGWELELSGVAGEYHLREMLETALGEEESARAAAGWGGSEYCYYGNASGDGLLTLSVSWDSEADAAEFAESFTGYADGRLGAGATVPAPEYSTWRSWSDGETAVALSLDGARTDMVFTDRPGVLGKAGMALGGQAGDFPLVEEEEESGSSSMVVAIVIASLALLAAALAAVVFFKRGRPHD